MNINATIMYFEQFGFHGITLQDAQTNEYLNLEDYEMFLEAIGFALEDEEE